MSTLRYGSLFAGIGGLDLGLDRAGMKCAWQVEINPFCQKVLSKHWPEVPKYEDVREVGSHNLAPVDLICGGFPCQDISYAGKGAGIEGKRSGLWKEFFRVICKLRPRFVLVENVPALLSRGLGVVLGDLAMCGYDAEWSRLSACSLGAPHMRQRVFIVAYDDSIRDEKVSDHMTTYVLCVEPNDPISRVADLCITRRVRRIPVVENGRLVGLIARRDVLKALNNAATPIGPA